VQASKGRLYGLVWIRPHTETVTKEFRDYLKANRKWLVGLKFHPWHSQMAIDDKRLEPYLALAKELKLPVLVHTSVDENSLVAHVVNAAKAHPDVNFLAGHMNMGGDKAEIIAAMRDLPNLYGDTAGFFGDEDLLKAIQVDGTDKLLFGTDAPVGGDDTYAASYRAWDALRSQLTSEQMDKLLHGNALRLFGLPPL
jgi:predicted TIM-barrel fold metal-dependent hydrolase